MVEGRSGRQHEAVPLVACRDSIGPHEGKTMPKENKKSTTYHVTAEIIAGSQRQNSRNCMTAAAMNLTHKNLKMPIRQVEVDEQTIRYRRTDDNQRYIWFTPAKVLKAIKRFELGLPVEPFSFQLNEERVNQKVPVYHPEARQPEDKPKAAKKVKAPAKIKVTPRVLKARKDRKSDGVRLTVEGGKPLPRFKAGGTRRVFGQTKLSLSALGPEFEEWVHQEVARQVSEQTGKPVEKKLGQLELQPAD
jgi:hypothetical protein